MNKANAEYRSFSAAIGAEVLFAFDSGELSAAFSSVFSTPYKLIDSADFLVGRGRVNGPSIEVPSGNYILEIQAGPSTIKRSGVEVVAGEFREITVQKTGSGIDVTGATTQAFSKTLAYGRLSSNLAGGKSRVMRIQTKLRQLVALEILQEDSDPGEPDGEIGPKTRRSIRSLSFVVGTNVPALLKDLPLVEKHLDCLINLGMAFEG